MSTNKHIQQFKSYRKVCTVKSGDCHPVSSLPLRHHASSSNLIERLMHLRQTQSVFSPKFAYVRLGKILVLLKYMFFLCYSDL